MSLNPLLQVFGLCPPINMRSNQRVLTIHEIKKPGKEVKPRRQAMTAIGGKRPFEDFYSASLNQQKQPSDRCSNQIDDS